MDRVREKDQSTAQNNCVGRWLSPLVKSLDIPFAIHVPSHRKPVPLIRLRYMARKIICIVLYSEALFTLEHSPQEVQGSKPEAENIDLGFHPVWSGEITSSQYLVGDRYRRQQS